MLFFSHSPISSLEKKQSNSLLFIVAWVFFFCSAYIEDRGGRGVVWQLHRHIPTFFYKGLNSFPLLYFEEKRREQTNKFLSLNRFVLLVHSSLFSSLLLEGGGGGGSIRCQKSLCPTY